MTKNKGVKPIVAGAAGAAIGAGIGAAAASIMQNEKSRKKAIEVINMARDRVMEQMPTKVTTLATSQMKEGIKLGKTSKTSKGLLKAGGKKTTARSKKKA